MCRHCRLGPASVPISRIMSAETGSVPQFAEKLSDVVGLYLNLPENATVLRVDEKSHVQALERMQPILPLREGVPERQTHDYYPHGTAVWPCRSGPR